MSVSSLFRLPRRTPKPGRHTIAAVRSQRADATVNAAADSARFPLPPGMPAPEAEAPAAAEAPEPLPLEPLPAPVPETFAEPDTMLLGRIRDGLRNLPAAYLRDIVAGQEATHEPLRGLPAFAGTDRAKGGAVAAGIWLGDQDGTGRFVIDGFDPDWFRALAAAAAEAAEAQEAAREAAA
jgi:hypothetical protein